MRGHNCLLEGLKMVTTQSEDPTEAVHHPRHYNQHPSNVECIELIEHLPLNLGCAVKYIWRCGLKATETPLRDLESAKWYTEREERRISFFEIDFQTERTQMKTHVVWRALARQVIESDPNGLLTSYLRALLNDDFGEMRYVLDCAIQKRKTDP